MTGRDLLLKAIRNETTPRPAWLPFVGSTAAGFRSGPKDAPATGLECIVSGPRLEEVRSLLADLVEKEG